MGRRKAETTKVVKPKKKSSVKKFFGIMLFWIIVLLIISAISFAVYYICTSDNLKVQNVKIKKSTYYLEQQILEVANIKKDKNMIFLGRGKIKEKILKELPYIEHVKFKIAKEGTLEIIVTERTSKYVVNNKDTNEYIRIDKHGIMLEKVNSENILPEEVPFFGLSLDKNEEVGKSIPETEFKKIQRYETIYEAYLVSNIASKITSVQFENSKIILTLDYKTEVVTEVFNNLEYKMKFLKEILKEVSGKSGKIDLTLDNPTFVEKLR